MGAGVPWKNGKFTQLRETFSRRNLKCLLLPNKVGVEGNIFQDSLSKTFKGHIHHETWNVYFFRTRWGERVIFVYTMYCTCNSKNLFLFFKNALTFVQKYPFLGIWRTQGEFQIIMWCENKEGIVWNRKTQTECQPNLTSIYMCYLYFIV